MEDKPEYKRNKGGRPKVAVQKKKRISLNCTSADYRVIKSKAERSNLSLSDYCLRSAMSRPLPKVYSPERVEELRQLTGMANNLNQIAHSVNAGERLKMGALKSLEKLSELITELQR